MKALIEIYATYNQSKKVNGVKEVSPAIRTIYKTEIVFKKHMPIAKQLTQVDYSVTRCIAERYALFIKRGTRLPSTLFYKVDIEGRIFSSEKILVKAGVKQFVKISFKKMAEFFLKDRKGMVNHVAEQHATAITDAVEYLKVQAQIFKDSEKINESRPELLFMEVTPDGELAELPELVVSEKTDSPTV